MTQSVLLVDQLKTKTCVISPEVHEAILERGKMGQTFDEVLRELLGLPAKKS